MSSKVAVPAGSTFFDELKDRTFSRVVTEDGTIPTGPFLEASRGLTNLFDLLGGIAFGPVKLDMDGNITKISRRYDSSPSKPTTIQGLVAEEQTEKVKPATEGLLWLTRGLAFTAIAIRRNVENPSEELAASFRGAYGETLKKHHSFVIKPIFSAAMSATPSRNDFYKRLGDDRAKVEAQLGEWLQSLEWAVEKLRTELAKHSLTV